MHPFFAALLGSFVGPFVSKSIDSFFGTAKRVEAERDVLLSLICENIDILLKDLVKFWGQSAQAIGDERIPLAAAIQARLHSMNMLQNDLLEGNKDSLKNTKDEWKVLHRVATGGNADDDDRPADGNRLRVTLQAGYQLRHGICKRRAKMNRTWFSG